MLTSKHRQKVPIPHEADEWLELRMLSGKQLQQAQDARTRAVLENVRAMGGEVMREMQGVKRADVEETLQADPLAAYDLDALLRFAVVGWSYQERVTPQAIEDLDEETRDWAAREVLRISQRSEADRKNS